MTVSIVTDHTYYHTLLPIESNVLQIDPTLTKVRAVPEKRCVLILREIAKDTPKEVGVAC